MRLLSRSHPLIGWLKLQGRDYQRTLDKLLECRDRDDNPNHTGPTQEFIDWVWQEQLPRLAIDPFYVKQIRDEIDWKKQKIALLEQQIRAQSGSLQEEASCIAIERQKLQELLNADDHDGGSV